MNIDSVIPRWKFESIGEHEKIYNWKREYIVVVIILMHVKRNA